jgi:hypothetical protein
MTSPTQPKSTQVPVLLVYGTPTSPELTQASWFRVEDKEAANVAAEALKFSVIDIQTDAEKALTVGVHEGVLKGNGRMIVGSVSSDVYRRIDEYARKAAGTDAAFEPANTEGAPAIPTSEQTTNKGATATAASSSAPAAASTSKPENPNVSPPNPWETLRVGARVLAAYWNEKREFEGFWVATVKRIDKGEFTLEWFEAPEYPTFKSRPKNIAIPHPEFRVSGK